MAGKYGIDDWYDEAEMAPLGYVSVYAKAREARERGVTFAKQFNAMMESPSNYMGSLGFKHQLTIELAETQRGGASLPEVMTAVGEELIEFNMVLGPWTTLRVLHQDSVVWGFVDKAQIVKVRLAFESAQSRKRFRLE